MLRHFLILIMIVTTAATTHAQDIKVMSYNIRLDYAGDGENRWDNRKELLAGQIQFYEPDFLGVQEALPNQMDYLKQSLLRSYKAIGVGRDDGKAGGEHSAIFYNDLKFKVIKQATFWLSTTPEKPSKGWDAAYNRICTYGLFEERATGKQLWVFNTHFDHVGNTARAESAKLILEKIKQVNTTGLPFVLTGDFNLEPETEPILFIKNELGDTRDIAQLIFGNNGTFNGFEFNKPLTSIIDYIFVPKNTLVKKYAVLSDSKNCRYPSDHLPVYAEISF